MSEQHDVVGRMPLADELAAVFARMSGLLASEETTTTALSLVTSLAAEVLPGTTGAGITLVDPTGGRVSAAATDAVVERTDALQYELDEGPCLTAWEQRTTVRVTDVLHENRWPRWAAAAGGTGIRSCLSAAMVAGNDCLGALKVYSSEPERYGADGEHVLRMFAAQAAGVMAAVRAAEKARHVSDELKRTVRSRDVIALAKGVLMEREHVTEETAFMLLVARARAEGSGMQTTAARIVHSTARPRH